MFTRDRIRRISDWLKDPNIHPLNCGVYAMKDLLAGRDIEVPLEELSVASLTVDLMSDIVRPGEPKLKTSLYAINKVVSAYGLDFKPAKLAPADILKLKTPFIAGFGSEHFVTVTGVDAQNVYYTDIGRAESMPREDFAAQLSGFVFAELPGSDGRGRGRGRGTAADDSSFVSHPSSVVPASEASGRPSSRRKLRARPRLHAGLHLGQHMGRQLQEPARAGEQEFRDHSDYYRGNIDYPLCGGATSWFGLVGNTAGLAGNTVNLAGGAANTVSSVTPAMSSVSGTSLSVGATSTPCCYFCSDYFYF